MVAKLPMAILTKLMKAINEAVDPK
jgi:hypothetical protein